MSDTARGAGSASASPIDNSHGKGLKNRLGDLAVGLGLPFAGVGLLVRGPGLLGLALFPALLTLVGTLGSLALVVGHSDSLAMLFWDRPAACIGCDWGAWVWTRLAVGAWQVFRFLTAILVVTATALLFARVISAPFMDVLAKRALNNIGVKPPAGLVPEGDQPFFRSLVLSQRNALIRALLYLVGLVLIALLTLIPGGAMASTPLGLVWTAVWLFADTATYPLQWIGNTGMRDITTLAGSRPLLTAGFASCLTLLMMIPLAGLLTTPMAIAGSCLLVRKVKDEEPEGEELRRRAVQGKRS